MAPVSVSRPCLGISGAFYPDHVERDGKSVGQLNNSRSWTQFPPIGEGGDMRSLRHWLPAGKPLCHSLGNVTEHYQLQNMFCSAAKLDETTKSI